MKKLLPIALLILLTLLSFGCKPGTTSTTTGKPAATPKPKPMHSLAKGSEKALVRDLKEGLALLEASREDTTSLAKGFTSQALVNLVNAIDEDQAAGKIKVRVFDKSDLQVSFASEKIVAVIWTYVDKSYYIDKTTNKTISEPTNRKQRFSLAAVKEGGRWKIGQIMLEAKPAGKESK